MKMQQISTEKDVHLRAHLTMDTFKGLVYVKHGRVGTRSEGPDYYLQTTRGDFLLRYRERSPWERDYHLEFFDHRMVAVRGSLDDKIITVKAIEEIQAPLLPVDRVRQMKLIVGDSTTMDDVTFGFDGIHEDSRCPSGNVCVWEGQAVAALWASYASDGPVAGGRVAGGRVAGGPVACGPVAGSVDRSTNASGVPSGGPGISGGFGIDQFFLALRAGHPELAVKTVLGKRFKLLDVEPFPSPTVRIDPERYEITLEVESLGMLRPM